MCVSLLKTVMLQESKFLFYRVRRKGKLAPEMHCALCLNPNSTQLK